MVCFCFVFVCVVPPSPDRNLEGYDRYRGSSSSDPKNGRENEDDWMRKQQDVHYPGSGT